MVEKSAAVVLFTLFAIGFFSVAYVGEQIKEEVSN
jgi:hypothetical protein